MLVGKLLHVGSAARKGTCIFGLIGPVEGIVTRTVDGVGGLDAIGAVHAVGAVDTIGAVDAVYTVRGSRHVHKFYH